MAGGALWGFWVGVDALWWQYVHAWPGSMVTCKVSCWRYFTIVAILAILKIKVG